MEHQTLSHDATTKQMLCFLKQTLSFQQWTLRICSCFPKHESRSCILLWTRGDRKPEAALASQSAAAYPLPYQTHGLLPPGQNEKGGYFSLSEQLWQSLHFRGERRCKLGLSCCSQVINAQVLPCLLYPVQKRAPQHPAPTLK